MTPQAGGIGLQRRSRSGAGDGFCRRPRAARVRRRDEDRHLRSVLLRHLELQGQLRRPDLSLRAGGRMRQRRNMRPLRRRILPVILGVRRRVRQPRQRLRHLLCPSGHLRRQLRHRGHRSLCRRGVRSALSRKLSGHLRPVRFQMLLCSDDLHDRFNLRRRLRKLRPLRLRGPGMRQRLRGQLRPTGRLLLDPLRRSDELPGRLWDLQPSRLRRRDLRSNQARPGHLRQSQRRLLTPQASRRA